MTSSAKKKKDKKKDFQKTQLKVGKTKPKPSNFTDTSFKARSIVVQSQSLSVEAPNTKSQFSHHVSMLRNHSETQRAESLAFLTTAISQAADVSSLPESPATLIPKLQPLMIDSSLKVRQQLMRLLPCFPRDDVRAHADKFLLYLHAAMTSLHASIRSTSMDVLEWLMDTAGQEIVSSPGGWVKTILCFQGLLGWQDAGAAQNGWSSQQKPSSRPGADSKIAKRQVTAFNRLLSVGLVSARAGVHDSQRPDFPLRCVRQHLVPERSDAYAYLNLFGAPRDDESRMIEDLEDRQRVFVERFATAVLSGVNTMIKEGGDTGRSAGQLKKTVEDGLSGYQQEVGFG